MNGPQTATADNSWATHIVGPQRESDLNLWLVNQKNVTFLQISTLFWLQFTQVFHSLHDANHIWATATRVTNWQKIIKSNHNHLGCRNTQRTSFCTSVLQANWKQTSITHPVLLKLRIHFWHYIIHDVPKKMLPTTIITTESDCSSFTSIYPLFLSINGTKISHFQANGTYGITDLLILRLSIPRLQGFIQVHIAHIKCAFWEAGLPRVREIFNACIPVIWAVIRLSIENLHWHSQTTT